MTDYYDQNQDLHRFAKSAGIPVVSFKMEGTPGIAVDIDGHMFIGIDSDQIENGQQYRTIFAHEEGHCATRAFYVEGMDTVYIARYEKRADKWAIEHVVPREELFDKARYMNEYELAEYFNVEEELIRKAMCWYVNHNLDDWRY